MELIKSTFYVQVLIKALSESNNIKDLIPPAVSLEEAFKWIWDKEEFHEIPVTSIEKNRKDSTIARNHLLKGKKKFDSENYPDAFHFFTSAIHFAEDKPCEIDENDDLAISLGLAYAHRATVLFILGQRELSLLDISRAIKHGCSEETTTRLLKMKANCEAEIKEKKLAEEMNRGASTSSDSIDGEEIFKSPECCRTELCVNTIRVNKRDFESKYSFLFPKRDFPLPDLAVPHPLIPSLTASAEISHSGPYGVCITATKAIYPGEVVIKEENFAISLEPEVMDIYCTWCSQRTAASVPCPNCASVVFCNEDCAQKALDAFHRAECDILERVQEINQNHLPLLSLRTILRTPFDTLKENVVCYETDTRPKELLAFDQNSIYSSEDFRTIYFMRNNERKKVIDDSMNLLCIVLSLLMVKILALQGSYVKFNLNQIFNMESDALFLSTLFYKQMICSMTSNHPKSTIVIKPKKKVYGRFSLSLSSLIGLLNHSCNPSIQVYEYGRHTVCRATKLIQRGEAFTLSLVNLSNKDDWYDRGFNLELNFNIDCSCEACWGEWPFPFSGETMAPYLQYSNCTCTKNKMCQPCAKEKHEVIPQIGSEKIVVTRKQLNHEMQRIFSNYKISEIRYDKERYTQSDIDNIITAMIFLCAHTDLPSTMYHKAKLMLVLHHERFAPHDHLRDL